MWSDPFPCLLTHGVLADCYWGRRGLELDDHGRALALSQPSLPTPLRFAAPSPVFS